MIGVPPVWLAAASGTHRPIWSVDLLAADGTVQVAGLPVVGGQLTMDESRTPRTEANVDVPATAVPQLLDQQLLPQGNRLRLRWSVGHAAGASYRYTEQASPPDLPGQYNQFAAVCQVNRYDADGKDLEADAMGATGVTVAMASDGGSDTATLPLIDRAGNGHVRLNGAGTGDVHTFTGPLYLTLTGGREWATMADLDLVAAAIARPENMWTLSAVDRSARIGMDDLARAAAPDVSGQVVADAIRTLVNRTFPSDTVTATGRSTVVALNNRWSGTDFTGSPWRFIEAFASYAESEAYYHRADRVCMVRNIPGIGAPVDALSVGDGGQITGYVVHHQMGVNTTAALFVDNTSGQVVRGVWEDRRADSPVAVQRIGSNVTRAADQLEVSQLPSQAQADQAAAAAGIRWGGLARAMEVRHPARPWLDPGDTITVTLLGGPTEDLAITSIGIDLGPDNIQVTRLRNHTYSMGVPA